MVLLDSLKKIGITNYQLDKWSRDCLIYIDGENVDIIGEDVYSLIMDVILMKYPDMIDEFIDQGYNESLSNYYKFLKMILDGKLDESRPLMKSLLRDEAFMEEYEKILLFVSIIDEYKLRDLYIPEEENNAVKKQISLFKKYLLSFNYPMAREFLKVIRDIHDCLEYKVVDAILESKKDTIKYILKPGIYPSKVTNDNLKRMERELLCNLELGNYELFFKRISELDYIYQNQERNYFQIIREFINIISMMQQNRHSVSSRSSFIFRGDFNSVLYALISCRDYYRAHDLIEEEIRQASRFDIYLAMLFILIHVVMYLNQYNLDFINKQMETYNGSSLEGILPSKVMLSKLEGNLLKNQEENIRNREKENINYYQLYLEAYKKADYKKAQDFLKMFCKRLKEIDVGVNVDYLFRELDYLIDKNKDKEIGKDVLEHQNQALMLMGEKRYREASSVIDKWCESLDYFHPRAMALKAKCYYEMGQFLEALKLYEEAEDYYLYPSAYEDIIMILYNLGEYERIEKYFAIRESYDCSSLKIYYVISIVALKKGDYAKAKEMLDCAQEVGIDIYNIIPDYSHEFEVIEELKKGKEVLPYTLDDYIEYGITDEDELVLASVDKFKKKYGDDFLRVLLLDVTNKEVSKKEKIDYLLSVIKIIKSKEEKVDLNLIYEYIERLLKSEDLESLDVRRFTLTMKNYQNL